MKRKIAGAALACCFLLAGCRDQPAAVAPAQPFSEVPPQPFTELPPPQVSARDWPWWHGPNRDNHAAGEAPPTHWSKESGVLWKQTIPGSGHSTPIIVGEQIILTTADEQKKEQSVLALDRQTGALRWQTVVHRDGLMKKHVTNTYASATPASDGERIFVSFQNGDALWVSALDMAGKILWQSKAGAVSTLNGDGSSPVVCQSLVIVNSDNVGTGFLAAVHRQSGAVVWTLKRREGESYGTPIVAMVAGRLQLLLCGRGRVEGYDPNTRELLWSCEGPEHTGSTVVAGEDMVFAAGDCPDRMLFAIRADGKGDVTATHLAWKWKKKSEVGYCPSMLFEAGHVFVVSDEARASCFEAKTGKQRWSNRLKGGFFASPVLAGGNIYATNTTGTTLVFKAEPERFTLVAQNELDEGLSATPVIVGGRIYLRTAHSLYCIGKPSE